jgi:hypothetical protein
MSASRANSFSVFFRAFRGYIFGDTEQETKERPMP